MPKIDLFPRACRVAHFLFDQLRHSGLSEHGTGSGPALDAALYDGLETHGFLYRGEQLEFGDGSDV